MRIFTLGKNGIPLFFFALFLFSGTYMYGQDCPTTAGTPSNQEFCYLQTVGDIDTDGTAVFQTDDNTNDTQPIPEDEVLTDGATYYVGGTSGDCDRIAVTVTVNVVEEPTNTIFPNSNSFEISPCSVTNFTADDLAGYFEVTLAGYEVVVYTSQFGNTMAEGELTPGESYFVGQVSEDPNNCPSLRAAVGYNPNNPNPPQAEALQTFCPGATVAALQAEETYPNTQAIRWYRTAQGGSPLAENTTLLNGQIYYAEQIVNDREQPFPPCASEERTPVEVVVITDGLGNDSVDNSLCRLDVADTATEGQVENLFMSFLDNPIPGGTFSPSIADLTAQFNGGDGTGTFSTTYTVAEGTTCEDEANLAVTVTPAANAGESNTGTIICRSDLPPTLDEEQLGIILQGFFDGDVTPGGEFSPSLADLTTQFNEGDGIGTFSTTYTVGKGSCQDSAQYSVVVIGTDAAGNNNTDTVLCRSDLAETATEGQVEALFMSLLDNAVEGGTFFPSIAQITSDFNGGDGTGTFSTTYTIGEGTACEDFAELAVTVTPAANAGADNTSTILCRSQVADTPTESQVLDFFEGLLDEGATTGGVYSPSIADVTAQFNAGDGIGTFSTTYTVSGGTSCEDSAELSVTVIGTGAAGENNTDTVLCRSDLAETATEDQVEALFMSLLDNAVEGGTFFPSIAQITSDFNGGDGTGIFSTTYTIGEGTACEDFAELAVTVTPAANAGADNTSTILCRSEVADTPTESQVLDFFEGLLDENATTGGVFSPSIADLTAEFNAGDGIGTFSTTYTVGEGTSCEDSAELAVTVIGSGAAGSDNVDSEVCFNTETATESEVEDLFEGLLSGAVSGGTFSPDFATLTTQMNNSDGTETFSTTYTIGEGTACEDSAELAVTIIGNGGNAGADNTSTILCRSEVADTPTESQVLDFFEGLLDENATTGGVFSPSIADLTAEFNAGDGIGTFSTTYTVGEGTACEDSAELAVTVIGSGAAGSDNVDSEVCFNTETATESEVEDLFEGLLSGAVSGGTFSPDFATLTTQINNSGGTGTFSTTYTIGEGTACEDSAELAVTITGNGGNAGADNTSTVFCRSELAETATEAQVLDVFEGLLDDSATAGGTFSPSIADLTAEFNAGDGIGTFSTTYTVGEGTACEASAELAVTVIGSGAAGSDNVDSEVCFNTETATESEVEDLFEGLLSGAVSGGTFSPDFATLTTQMNNSDGTGTFSTTYTIGEGTACEDSAELAITIIGNGGNAGADNTSTVFCRSELAETATEAQVLGVFEDLLDDSATAGGTFSPSIADLTAEFNAGDGIGTFSTTYTVGEGTACEDSAQLAVTVIGSGAAGADNLDTVLCRTQVAETPTVTQVRSFFLNLLDENVSQNGTFSPSIEDITADFNAGEGVGTFSTTYTIGAGTTCEDSAELSVAVLESLDAGLDAIVNLEEGTTETFNLFH